MINYYYHIYFIYDTHFFLKQNLNISVNSGVIE